MDKKDFYLALAILTLLFFVLVCLEQAKARNLSVYNYFDQRQIANYYEYSEGIKIDTHGDSNALNLSTGDKNDQTNKA